MDEGISGEALRLHRFHCVGCGDCRRRGVGEFRPKEKPHAASFGTPVQLRATPPTHTNGTVR